MQQSKNQLPPVIILGGVTNALSIARSLGRAGIQVYAINDSMAPVRFSRYCRWLRVPWLGDEEQSLTSYLFGPDSDFLRGAVLLAAEDSALEFIMEHRDQLLEKYLLDESNPQAQRCMLNKLTTYQAAAAAGVPTPRFWVAPTREEVLQLKDDLVYPLLVKPLYTHKSAGRLGQKFIVAQNFDELLAAHRTANDADVDTLLLEMIPGPDDRLCSYYTYLDEKGDPLVHFTKRIIRRFPPVTGEGCYHITDWIPEARDLGLKLFRQVGLRGLANVEFKRDERDGQLKLIECNARFTAANCLVADSGVDLALFVYNHLVGRPQPGIEHYTRGLRLWSPMRDFKAFLALRKQGQLTFGRWIASICHRQTFPYFRWFDPVPTLVRGLCAAKVDVLFRGVRNLVRRGLAACGLIRKKSAAGPKGSPGEIAHASPREEQPAELVSSR